MRLFGRLLVNAMVKIGTHDGAFHADEALACAMLRLLPRYKEADIVRTRDPKILAECDLVYYSSILAK